MQTVAVHALGSNGSGQLAVGHRKDLPIPGTVKGHELSLALPITGNFQIAPGGNHTVFTSNGGANIYVSGHVPGTTINTEDVILVPLPKSRVADGSQPEIKRIAATWTALFLISNAAIWAMGVGNSGELGLGPGITDAMQLTEIPDFPPQGTRIVDISASMAHVVALLSNGDVWGWGSGRRAQLGMPAENVWSPRKIEGICFPVEKAVCGKDFTCVIGEPERGLLSVIGASGKDRFGIISSAPGAIPGWKKICASWGSVVVLLTSGKIVAWGRDDHGQLPPSEIPLIEDIAAGSEHCVALTASSSPEVLAWGWGEHGNCGALTDDRGDVKGRTNRIEVPGVPSAVFAGCATTFIVAQQRPSLDKDAS